MSDRPGQSRQSFLARASVLTAAGTVASRVTGLVRLAMVAYALGSKEVANAFNLSNTTPNIIHDLVLGGVLAATFVPVFVSRLSTVHLRAVEDSISAVVTASALLLVVATLLFELLAPAVIDLYTFHAATPDARHLAVVLLRMFAPQLAFYGAISVMSAVLATRDRFVAVGVAPIVNNVISIVVLFVFHSAEHNPEVVLNARPGLVLLLGLGTTAGVAAQALALVPSFLRSGPRPLFIVRFRDPAVRMVVSLSGWTLGIVATNQVAVFVVLALAWHLSGTTGGAVSDYTYAFTFFQFPFGIVATSIVNVATPDLARAFADEDLRLLGARFGRAMRQLCAVILPATTGYLVLARPAVALIIQHGAEQVTDARTTGTLLALLAVGLPGYCIFFLAVRTFQAMRDTRTACLLYALENATNILVALAVYHRLGIQGVALSYSLAYALAAVVALILLRARIGTLGGRRLAEAATRSTLLSLATAIVVALVATVTGSGTGISGLVHLIVQVAAGAVIYLGGAGVAGTLAAQRQARRVTGSRHDGGRS